MEMKHSRIKSQRGNALVYVLVGIALFAALSFTLSRQTDTAEGSSIDEGKVELYASQLISYASQAKGAIDMMLFSGSDIADLDFTLPTESGFNTGSAIHKVYHPQGGGLTPGRINERIQTGAVADPVSGWYLGRFNNVDWTALGPGNTAGAGGAEAPYEEVMLIAYQINRKVCENINFKINGSTAIPVIGDTLRNVFIDDSIHAGSNVDLSTSGASPICAECENVAMLCVANAAENAYGFYTIIADQ